MQYIHNQKIKDYLQKQKYSSLVIDNGLNRLIPNWRKQVNINFNTNIIEEYINYLDGRRIIDEILDLLSENERKKIQNELDEIDDLFRQNTFETNQCILRKEIEQEELINRIDHWYYYRITKLIFDTENKRRKNKFTILKLNE